MSISSRKINNISKYIFNNFNIKKIKLIYYLSEYIDKIAEEKDISLNTDEIDELCYVNSNSFIQLAKNLIVISKENKYKSNIKITYCIDYYIELTAFGDKRFKNEREQYLNIVKKISYLPMQEKGFIFEKLCSLFLEDLGVECKVTSKTGDEGIDILGAINLNSDNLLFKCVFDEKIYLLAQVKCYEENKKVDTPVIRHLIGDSNFYKYNKYNSDYIIGNKPVYLMIFSFSGFTKPAVEFAKVNNVIIFNKYELVDLICNFDNVPKLESVKYLMNLNLDKI